MRYIPIARRRIYCSVKSLLGRKTSPAFVPTPRRREFTAATAAAWCRRPTDERRARLGWHGTTGHAAVAALKLDLSAFCIACSRAFPAVFLRVSRFTATSYACLSHKSAARRREHIDSAGGCILSMTWVASAASQPSAAEGTVMTAVCLFVCLFRPISLSASSITQKL